MQSSVQQLLSVLALSTLASLVLAADHNTDHDAPQRPNILLIITDDMGYSDLGSFGGEIPTPNLDALAMSGVRFSNFLVHPACSPTRATLYTGVDPHLAGVGNMYEELSPNQKGQPGYEGHLNDRVVSVATLLRDTGYSTYLSGKWHLANQPEQGAKSQGFQRSFALNSGGASHFGDMRPAYHPDPEGKAAYVEDDQTLTQLPAEFEYSTKYYADKLLSYLREDQSGKPFFAVLAYTAPHWPLQAPDEAIAKYKGRYDSGYDKLYAARRQRVAELGLIPAAPEPPRPPAVKPWAELDSPQQREQARAMEIYAAMIDEIDVHTGRVIDYLRAEGELDNTFIVFMSDNGPEGHDLDETWPGDLFPAIRKVIDERHDFSFGNMGRPNSYVFVGHGWAMATSAGLRMYKAFPSEGGTRVTAFARFPRLIEAGSVHHEPVPVRDIVPTFLELAEIEHPGKRYRDRAIYPLQGQSLLPRLQDSATARDALLLGTELFGKYSLRHGDWKLLVMPPPYASGNYELYNIQADPGEANDLSQQESERLAAMIKLWEAYVADNGVILPDWVSGY
ncbi:MAG: arylsulfatase [Pseudomonadota bacterium]